MRILFAGSPHIAVPSLDALAKTEGIRLAGVLTNPDTPKKRTGDQTPTEIAQAAEKLGVPVLKLKKLDAAARDQVAALKPDLLVSFAYARLFGPKFLALFPLGGVNIHPSILPKYRGPSPVQAAILNRDSETGISIQTLSEKMDTGDILALERFQLTGRETAQSLGGIVSEKAALMLPDVLKKYASSAENSNVSGFGTPQNHSEASYCALVTMEDSFIDWKKSALEIDAQIRAFNPWPLSRTIHNGRELIVLKADVFSQLLNDGWKEQPGQVLGINKQYGILIQTGDGVLAVTELQYQAKKALFWRDFLNGARDFTGSLLG